jgi:hypothetical protein
MTEVNYLPAIKRAVLAPAAGLRQAPVRADFDFGNKRVHLTDVAFFQLIGTAVNNPPIITVGGTLARIGKFGSELLTEDFYPLTMFGTKPRQEYGVWEFPKPYRLFPGERLSASITYAAGAGARGGERDCTVPAVQFNAVRIVDNRPILLHDNANARMGGVAATSIRLISENLQCPADSPIDIYSCVLQPNSGSTTVFGAITVTELMIYGPDGRKWWDDPTWRFLFDTPGFLMDLGKSEWILEPGESFYAEFITPAAACDLAIVLRGQIEVMK